MNDIVINDGSRNIKLCHNVLNVMYKYIQQGALSKEAGGILIGKENMSNSNLIINKITIPMDQDDSRYNRFIRRDRRHITYFNTIYNKSKKTLRYLGEWHTHPEAVPIYSNIDLKNWEKIYRGADYKNSYYHIIVGYEVVRIWKFEHTGQSPQLVGFFSWEDIKGE